jgi:hypothetical protein
LEATAWAAVAVGLELLGSRLPASDVSALGLLSVVGLPLAGLAVVLARRGWLPGTRALAERGRTAFGRWSQRLVPRFELALRLDPKAPTRPDPILVVALVVLGASTVAAAVLGPSLTHALDLLRSEVSVVLWLLALATLWLGLLGLLTLAFALEAQLIGPVLAVLLTAAGLLAAVLMPGYVFTIAVLGMGLAQSVRLARRPLAPYVFTRSDATGAVRTVRAQTLLRRVHLLCTLALALLVTLGNSDRLAHAGLARGPYSFTACLGLLACLASVLLMARVDLHFGRLLCARTDPPETPLDPTLGWMGPAPVPVHVAAARTQGWTVTPTALAEPELVDLVTGPGAQGPRRVELDPAATDADRAFRLKRRLDVVYRRELLRRLEALLKQTRDVLRKRGSGTLFCPHSWLIPCLLRDSGRTATPFGPPFHAVFHGRLRRYLGGVLRTLQVDVIYFEDGVRFPDLKRVLGVAFECYDQGRVPLRAHHFVGLPRVRVLLQQEDGPGAPRAPHVPGLPRAPVGSGARVLVILRDRGGALDLSEVQSPSDHRPAPLLG